MPLYDLVDYFNDRFGREHRSSFRPFVIKDNKVNGLFGSIRINSVFSPIREALKPKIIIGHIAKIEVGTYTSQPLCEDEIDNLLTDNALHPTHLESIINFDRLSRTVHMLNYLPLLPVYNALFLEVDPRHILGIKQDHGVYFEEVITRCGLQTNNIVIILSMHNQYTRYYRQLLTGLGNYRQQGYQIALKIDYPIKNQSILDLITELSPNYVSVSARNINLNNSAVLEQLNELTTTVSSSGGYSILQQIDQQKTDLLARNAHFNLVEGSHYRATI